MIGVDVVQCDVYVYGLYFGYDFVGQFYIFQGIVFGDFDYDLLE